MPWWGTTYYINNDLVEGDSAICQPEETLLTATVFSRVDKNALSPATRSLFFYYTDKTIDKKYSVKKHSFFD